MFGSQAYGTVNEDSDYDIAIIKNVNKPYRERLIEIRNLVRTTVPIDFFIFNQNEIDRYKDNNPIVKNILTEGKVLYEQ
jgi:predicted nucleotidyltransferase